MERNKQRQIYRLGFSSNGNKQDNEVFICDVVIKGWKMRFDEFLLDSFVDLGRYIRFDFNINVFIFSMKLRKVLNFYLVEGFMFREFDRRVQMRDDILNQGQNGLMYKLYVYS